MIILCQAVDFLIVKPIIELRYTDNTHNLEDKTMETIKNLNINALLAANELIDPKEPRDFLRYVCLTQWNGENVAVATNGHVLGVFKVDGNDSLVKCDFSSPICVKLGKPPASLKRMHTVDIEPLGEGKAMLAGSHIVDIMDGSHYPEWQAVVISAFNTYRTEVEVPGTYNPEYLMKFMKIGKLYGKSSPIIHVAQRGEKAALVQIGSIEGFGLIMPIKTHNMALPIWSDASLNSDK